MSKRGHLEDLGPGGEVILKWTFRNLNRGMGWTDMAQDRDRWLALVNTAMNVRFHKMCGFLD